MRAVVVEPNVTGRLVIREVDRPTSLPSEALVRVSAVSFNQGEVCRSLTAAAGWVHLYSEVSRVIEEVQYIITNMRC